MASISVDTSVLVEFMDRSGDYHPQADVLMQKVNSGRVTALVPHPVLAELFYVASRVYDEMHESDSLSRAGSFINWLYKSPNVSVPESNLDLALEAGRMKRKFGLSLVDSYVLAAAKLNSCKAVFKSPEAEMKQENRLSLLKNENVGILFLEDYEL